MKYLRVILLLVATLGAAQEGRAQSLSAALPTNTVAAEDEEQPADAEPVDRLSGERLRARFPMLRLSRQPRALATLGVGSYGLYLFGGIEGTFDWYPVDRMRVGLVYAFGFTLDWDEERRNTGVRAAQYAEAVVGARVWGRESESEEELQLRRSIGGYGVARSEWLKRWSKEPPGVPVSLPSSHGVFIEAGAMTGLAGLKRCVANCESTVSGEKVMRSVARQLLIPFAGVRYVYYSEAAMDQPPVHIRRHGQLFGHLLVHAFNAPSGETLYLNDHRAGHPPLGFRIGGTVPMSASCIAAIVGIHGACAEAGGSIGYLPFPDFVLLELHVRFPIE